MSWELSSYFSMCLILLSGSVMRSGLHSLKDMVPPSEACLYGHINWSLAQAWRQSSMGLSQSFPSKRGCKVRPWPAFHFPMQKSLGPGNSGASLAKKPHLGTGTKTHPSGKKSAGGSVSDSSAQTRRKGGLGVSTPEVLQSSASSSSSSMVFWLVCFPNF